MAISIPQMQQRFTGYDFGQNTARNLLDALRMKNQEDMQSKRIAAEERLINEYRNKQNVVNRKALAQMQSQNIVKDLAMQREREKQKFISSGGTGGAYNFYKRNIIDFLGGESSEAALGREFDRLAPEVKPRQFTMPYVGDSQDPSDPLPSSSLLPVPFYNLGTGGSTNQNNFLQQTMMPQVIPINYGNGG